jgi:hypothetical protein
MPPIEPTRGVLTVISLGSWLVCPAAELFKGYGLTVPLYAVRTNDKLNIAACENSAVFCSAPSNMMCLTSIGCGNVLSGAISSG